jgi:predicted amidohydrolase YtcJ
MDGLFYNGNVRTMDPAKPVASTVEIRGGRIAAVLRAGAELPSGIRAIDLGRRTVVPGFNDCHMHILPYGLDLAQADLSPAGGVSDVPSLIAALRAWSVENPSNEWVRGSRYDQNIFPGAVHPTRADLDAAFPDRPVWLTQTSKHAGAANSVALELAGITRETPDPDGGDIVRDSHGQPTGVLLESAMGLVSRHAPRPDQSGMVNAIRIACNALARVGITSASDLNTGWIDMESEIAAYRAAAEEGAPVRMTLCPHAVEFGSPDQIPNRSEFEREMSSQGNGVRLGPIKLFSDGALTVRTAALREPYVDGTGSGMLLHEPDVLREYILAAHWRGWQIATHAIGDRAIELVLDCYAEAQRELPRPNCRHRIEHAMLVDEGLIRRFVDQEVIPVVQPEFVARLGDAYILGLGRERADRLNPNATMQRAGLPIPFSSDCPIVPGAPLDGIRAACRRTTRKGTILGADERISPEEGLRNYTYWAAYSTFDETETGTIAPGKRADLCILGEDLTEETLDTVQVAATIAGGHVVFDRDSMFT